MPSDRCSGDATQLKRNRFFAEVLGDEDDEPLSRVNPKTGTDSFAHLYAADDLAHVLETALLHELANAGDHL